MRVDLTLGLRPLGLSPGSQGSAARVAMPSLCIKASARTPLRRLPRKRAQEAAGSSRVCRRGYLLVASFSATIDGQRNPSRKKKRIPYRLGVTRTGAAGLKYIATH
ncbi:MAG: hypothetical protein QG574_3747 [Cyanobacteriota bacterium erpe_2018_sw_21hr_WHONDRS-SW48-000092_B_bin.40]|nr:hypothetical protein [Cyanobacteriota bacterium erpe_2018_sw_21hr_WHONDRS-SW48-000092_B_bin.40]